MWLYLFGRNDRYPDPIAEIGALAKLSEGDGVVFLKLSARDDAPLKNAAQGQCVYLCTREEGRWAIHGEAALIDPPFRGETPPAMLPLYGPAGKLIGGGGSIASGSTRLPGPGPIWGWRRMPCHASARLTSFASRGQNGMSVESVTDESSGPLERLTAAMDAAWDEERVTAEAVESAVSAFRAKHPYGR